MGAQILKTPELEIDQKEAALLSRHMAEVASHYNVEIDPKVMAWVGFFGACGAIYGPRIAAFRIRKNMEREMMRRKNNPPVQQEPLQLDPAFAEGGILIPSQG